jgi:hypothetical protein
MPEKQNHIIYSHAVELAFYDRKENLYIQNRIADLVKDRLLPAMERLFDEQTSAGKKIKIDALELNLNEIENTAWEDEFVNRTIHNLRQKLNEIVAFNSADEVYEVSYKDAGVDIHGVPALDECLDNFHSFLQSGLLQWNLGRVTAGDLFEVILQAHRTGNLTPAQREKLLRSVFYSASAFERFILQLDQASLLYFFDHVLNLPEAGAMFELYSRVISEASPEEEVPRHRQKFLSWLFVLAKFQAEANNATAIPPAGHLISWLKTDFSPSLLETVFAGLPRASMLKQFFSGNEKNIPETKVDMNPTNPIENSGKRLHPSKKAAEDIGECFIDNAGLVILSPFLQQLFNNLKLSRKKQFRSEEAQVRAVLLSQFLVTGRTKIAEHELPLNKIICGYPLEKTLPCEFEPTAEETEQCDELFKSVLGYWEALKSTSVEALRNTYVVRNGKLVDKNEYFLLQVEYKAFDVMLQFLPWSIGVIYLPWMKKRLMVEWHA